MANKQPVYLSYLLRLWRADSQNTAKHGPDVLWRASLENPHTHEQQGFASLDDLFEFLRAQTGLTMPNLVSRLARTKPEPRRNQARSELSGRQAALIGKESQR